MKQTIRQRITERFGTPQLQPREIARKFGLIGRHYVLGGALLGVNLRIDPNQRASRPVWSALACGVLAVLAMLAPAPLSLAGLLIVLSPVWVYSIASTLEPVMENRGYTLGLSIAIALAWAWTYTPILVTTLIILYGVRTFQRNRVWQTGLSFWRQAQQENPDDVRALVNHSAVRSKHGEMDEALIVYERILASNQAGRYGGVVVANLANIYRQRDQIQDCARVLDYGYRQWPTSILILQERGRCLMAMERWIEAIDEFSDLIAIHPNHVVALRERATCWGRLGEEERALADGNAACAIDGIPVFITRVPQEVAN